MLLLWLPRPCCSGAFEVSSFHALCASPPLVSTPPLPPLHMIAGTHVTSACPAPSSYLPTGTFTHLGTASAEIVTHPGSPAQNNVDEALVWEVSGRGLWLTRVLQSPGGCGERWAARNQWSAFLFMRPTCVCGLSKTMQMQGNKR